WWGGFSASKSFEPIVNLPPGMSTISGGQGPVDSAGDVEADNASGAGGVIVAVSMVAVPDPGTVGPDVLPGAGGRNASTAARTATPTPSTAASAATLFFPRTALFSSFPARLLSSESASTSTPLTAK